MRTKQVKRKYNEIAWAQDLSRQLAAAIMDCIAMEEVAFRDNVESAVADGDITEDEADEGIIWCESRSDLYVDVARMAHTATGDCIRYGVGGVIYEVSEEIAKACVKKRDAISDAEIAAILNEWGGTDESDPIVAIRKRRTT